MICPVCGKNMMDRGFFRHKQLTVQKYRCAFCGLRKDEVTRNWVYEKRDKLDMDFKPTPKPTPESTPEPTREEVEEPTKCNLGDIMNEVLDNLYREHPHSYDEWEEP